MKTLVICRGLPGSGKSTWAREQLKKHRAGEAVIVNRDLLRTMLHEGKWTKERERVTKEARNAIIGRFLRYSEVRTVYCDDTNLDEGTVAELLTLAANTDAAWEIKDFRDVPVHVCLYRNAKRTGDARVPERVILEMAYKFGLPTGQPSNLPPAVICDIDGTVATNPGHRSFYAGGEALLKDRRRSIVIAALRGVLEEYGAQLIFLSGRKGTPENKQATASWLLGNVMGDLPSGTHTLLMREAHDNREDSIIKREIYEGEIAPRYNVMAVFDDRPQVITMWHEIGLGDRLFNVGPGYEF